MNEDFCSQEHAVQWLSRPLPPPTPLPPVPAWRDRLASAGVLLMFLVPTVFACIGIVAILAFLGLYD